MAGHEFESRNSEPRIGRSVSLDHAAELLGVSRRTVYNRIRDARLRTIRTAGGSQRVLVDSIGELKRQALDAYVIPVAPNADKAADVTSGHRLEARSPGVSSAIKEAEQEGL